MKWGKNLGEENGLGIGDCGLGIFTTSFIPSIDGAQDMLF